MNARWRGRSTRDGNSAADPLEHAARCVRSAAALLRGGISERRVFTVLARERPGSVEERVAERQADGMETADAIAEEDAAPWRAVGAAWAIARESGAPLAPALDPLGTALEGLIALRQRRAVILAGPRSSVITVASLPPLALVAAAVLGFNPWPVLVSTAGGLLVASGLVLLAGGLYWARRMQRDVARHDRVIALEFELLWIALGGGAAVDVARLRVTDAVDRFGAGWVPFDAFLRDAPLAQTVAAGHRTGVPLRPLLLQEAKNARARALNELEQRAEKLGVRVLFPIAICILPSFVLIGVAPVILSMLSL